MLIDLIAHNAKRLMVGFVEKVMVCVVHVLTFWWLISWVMAIFVG